MKNKKLTIALTATGLASATLVSLFAINKVIGKIATSKDLLNTRNKEIFNWRFGSMIRARWQSEAVLTQSRCR